LPGKDMALRGDEAEEHPLPRHGQIDSVAVRSLFHPMRPSIVEGASHRGVCYAPTWLAGGNSLRASPRHTPHAVVSNAENRIASRCDQEKRINDVRRAMHVHAKITDNRLPCKHIPTCPHLGITRGCPAEVRIILASRRRAGARAEVVSRPREAPASVHPF